MGYSRAMTSFNFLMALVATRKILGYTRGTTVNLRSLKIKTVGVAYQVINVIEALQHARDDAETYHKQWLQQATYSTAWINITIEMYETSYKISWLIFCDFPHTQTTNKPPEALFMHFPYGKKPRILMYFGTKIWQGRGTPPSFEPPPMLEPVKLPLDLPLPLPLAHGTKIAAFCMNCIRIDTF